MFGVELKNLSKSFGKTKIIQNINLEIYENKLTVFVGPSGCGKSTLLRMIAGLEEPTSGDLLISGVRMNNYPPSQRGVAMVFQSYALYPHMNVFENMAFGLANKKLKKEIIQEQINKVAETLGLTDLLLRYPRELSGGQRQRVAMGRAIVRNPKVFLFDEPLSNLDAALRGRMRVEIAKLRRELNATMIYVTHDQVEAMTLADQLVVLRAGQIEQIGSPADVYAKPKNKFVAGFLGSPAMNFLPSDFLQRNTSLSSQTQQVSEVGIRPEHMLIQKSADICFQAQVETIENLGDNHLIYFSLADQLCIARVASTQNILVGANIQVGFNKKDCHFFDQHGSTCSNAA